MMPPTARERIVSWSVLAFGLAVGALLAARERTAAQAAVGTAPPGAEPSVKTPARAQGARLHQRNRGRGAASPLEMPASGWMDILWRTYEEIGKDRLLAVAAGVVFYGLLALFPAVTALVSFYGLFADANTVSNHLDTLAGLMPTGGLEIVRDQIARITARGPSELTLAFAFSVAVAVWSANAGMKAIFDALNVVYEEEEHRSFVKLNAVSLAFTLGALLAVLVALGLVVVFPLVLPYLGAEGLGPILFSLLRWPLLFILIVGGISVLYRFGPSRRPANWRWLSAGAIVAALAWIGGSLAFSYYLANFADYNATYGSLGAVIGLMMWMWLSAVVILLGAELNAELEHQTARDTTTGRREKPLGRRGAAMADTVGPART